MCKNLILLLGWLVLITASSLGAEPSFTLLGDLPGGGVYSVANAVSADGTTVVGDGLSSLGSQAFRWTVQTGMVGLTAHSGSLLPVWARAVSGDGSVVVGRANGGTGSAFRWTQVGGAVDLGTLPGGNALADATGVSADGGIVVGWNLATPSNEEAFRWTQQTGMVGLGFLPGGNNSSATGVSGDGCVVVGQGNSGIGVQAFRWTAQSGMIGLGLLPGAQYTHAYATNADGSVVVGTGVSNVNTEAFRWTESEGMIGLGFPGSGRHTRNMARAVSADGTVIVGDFKAEDGTGAFIWDPVHGSQNLSNVLADIGLDLNGWRLRSASGISADGLTIVGSAANPIGDTTQAFMVRLPEPSTSFLVLVSGMLLLRRKPSP